MCGLVGAVDFGGRAVDPSVIDRMRALSAHRGPDDRGIHLFSLARGESIRWPEGFLSTQGAFDAALGFNRLSIQDLSDAGHQPMVSADGRIGLVYNGEIYNAPELRHELRQAGCPFHGHSDTEVLLRLYERDGLEATLERLNGMFAFAIVDLRTRALLLARDRLGIKPLYWARLGELVLFASEVKSFLAHPAFHAELDPEGIDECLAYRFCSDARHLLRGVQEVRPGASVHFTTERRTDRAYWTIPDPIEGSLLSFDQAVDELDARLEASVRRQLISDVKVGCQLSGGIDSSLITYYARQRARANLDSFSIVFRDPAFSEEPWISAAAVAAGVDSHRFLLDDEFVVDHLALASWHLDQPLNIPNSVGIFLLAQRSKSSVSVLLSGEGSDELLGGYNRFHDAVLREQLTPWLPLLQRLPRIGARVRKRIGGAADLATWFVERQRYLNDARLEDLRPDASTEEAFARRRAIFDEGKGDLVQRCTRYELRTWLVDLLNRQDKMTMAHSVENRVPLLDHEIITLVRSLPSRYLVEPERRLRRARPRSTKRLLKALALRTFPEEFVFRKKVGFGLPLGQLYRHPRFRELMYDQLLPGMKRRGLVRADVVERWWRDGANDPKGRNQPIWSTIALELWAGQFLDARHSHLSAARDHGAIG